MPSIMAVQCVVLASYSRVGRLEGGRGGGQGEGQLVLDQGDRGPAPARLPQQLGLDRLQRAEDGGPGPGVRVMLRSCI